MQMTLTEDQEQLRDSVTRFVRQTYTFDAWRRRAREPHDADAATWREIAGPGWAGRPWPWPWPKPTEGWAWVRASAA